MKDKREELLDLVTSGSSKIEAARKEFIKVCKEENEKVRKFFEDNKDELVIPAYIVARKERYPRLGEDTNELLTRNFKFEGYKNGFFYITNNTKLTKETIDQIDFLLDDQKELYNEIAVPATTKHKLDAGKYAVIIYPTDLNGLWRYYNRTVDEYIKDCPDIHAGFSIYVGKIIHENGNIVMKKFDRKAYKNEHFQVYSNLLKDFVIFDNDVEFSKYLSKYGYSNGMSTKRETLPEK